MFWFTKKDPLKNKSPMDLYLIANSNNQRWREAESIIATDPTAAYYYAKLVIRGRFPEGEAAILEGDYNRLINYALVRKTRWPEAEPIIRTNNSEDWLFYCQFFSVDEEEPNWVKEGF